MKSCFSSHSSVPKFGPVYKEGKRDVLLHRLRTAVEQWLYICSIRSARNPTVNSSLDAGFSNVALESAAANIDTQQRELPQSNSLQDHKLKIPHLDQL